MQRDEGGINGVARPAKRIRLKGLSNLGARLARADGGNDLLTYRVLFRGVGMAGGLIIFLGALALLVGILVAIPVIMLAMAAAYRALSAMTPETPKKPLSFGEIVLVCLVGLLIPLGIFASIALSALSMARVKGRAANTAVQMMILQSSLEIYYGDHNAYPPTLDAALETAAIPAANQPTVDAFTYTLADGDKAYTLCAKDPMPTGKEQCVTSDSTDSTSTPE